MQLGHQQLNLSTSGFQIVSINGVVLCGRCKGQEQPAVSLWQVKWPVVKTSVTETVPPDL